MIGDSRDNNTALAGSYVLGVLDDAEMDEAERRMGRDGGFAHEVGAWRQRFVLLDAMASLVAPLPALWQCIEASVAALQAAREAVRRPAARTSGGGIWQAIEFWRWSV